MITPQITAQQLRKGLVVAAALLAVVVWGVGRYFSPAPPKLVRMTTGAEQGVYHAYGQRYAKALAAQGVTLELMPSSGSVQNLERLTQGDASVGLVQGGLGTASTDSDDDDQSTPLRCLGVVTHEPVWIFVRKAAQGLSGAERSLAGFKGLRVVMGVPGSGSRKVALDLLELYGLPEASVTALPQPVADAAALLTSNQADAAVVVSSPKAAAVQAMLANPALALLELPGGLAAKLSYLQPVQLKRGAVDPTLDLPPRDINLLATTANLVVRDDLHPALAYLLLDVAKEIHRAATPFATRGAMPTLQGIDFPAADEATRYYKDGRPFLQRYLPFWLANFVQRLLLVIVPLVAILVPLFKFLPTLIDIPHFNRLYRRYDELMLLERDLKANKLSGAELAKATAKLDAIERDIAQTPFPLDFSDRVYTLRQHVDFVRTQLLEEAKTA